MGYSAKAIANYFLDLGWKEDISITPLKIQKLLYFAHGWHLGFTGDPLLEERVEAWEYGPVISSIYYEFREFGADTIDRKATDYRSLGDGDIKIYEPDIIFEEKDESKLDFLTALLNRVWKVYGTLSAIRLSDLTHAEGSPWQKARQGSEYINECIPEESIKKHFKKRVEEARG